MSDFSTSVARFCAKAKEKSDLAFQETVAESLDRIKERTPVDTGALRDAWRITDAADGDLSIDIKAMKLGQKVTIVNDMPYARRIEHGFVGKDSLGREYHQHGAGMVAQTVKELPRIAKEVVGRMSK